MIDKPAPLHWTTLADCDGCPYVQPSAIHVQLCNGVTNPRGCMSTFTPLSVNHVEQDICRSRVLTGPPDPPTSLPADRSSRL
jgi:hypothetical protein